MHEITCVTQASVVIMPQQEEITFTVLPFERIYRLFERLEMTDRTKLLH